MVVVNMAVATAVMGVEVVLRTGRRLFRRCVTDRTLRGEAGAGFTNKCTVYVLRGRAAA